MTPNAAPPKNLPAKRADIRGLNSLRNGKRIVTLALGELPKELARVTRYVRLYRRGLQDAILEVFDEVSPTAAHLVDEACAWEQHRRVCMWLVRRKIDKLSPSDLRECSKQMALATTNRNKAVERLDLDHKPDPWADVYSTPTEGEDDESQ